MISSGWDQKTGSLQRLGRLRRARCWKLLIPLALGCSVAILPQGRQYDVEHLAGFLEKRAVTYMDIVPALLASLVALESLPPLTRLRIVTCGAETLSLQLRDACQWRLAAQLFNTYGPTETTVQSTYWDCAMPGSGAGVPIGVPIANTRCYVLDGRMHPVPTGVTGALYIGGAGVADGYLEPARADG